MNETNDLMERIVAAVTDMDDFLSKGPSSSAAIVNEAKDTAEELLKNFQDELRHREEESIALRKENADLKNKIGEVTDLRETISGMEKQLEKIRGDLEQALKQRDEAKEESARLQALWNKVSR